MSTQGGFVWSPRANHDLVALVSRGYTYHTIGRRLGCSKVVVQRRAKQAGWVASRIETVFSINMVHCQFLPYLTRRVILKLVRDKLLSQPSISYTRQDGRRYRRLTLEQLEDFLEREDCWMLWQPEDLVIPWLREYWVKHRQEVGWHWMAAAEAAIALGYYKGHGKTLIYDGIFNPAYCILRRANRNPAWWVRSDEVERVKQTDYVRDNGMRPLAATHGDSTRYYFDVPDEQVAWLKAKHPFWWIVARNMIDDAITDNAIIKPLPFPRVPGRRKRDLTLASAHIQYLEQFGPWDDALRGLIQAAMEREQWGR